MRLTSTPTNHGMVPDVSPKYKIGYFRPNEGEEWLPMALVGFHVSYGVDPKVRGTEGFKIPLIKYKTMSERTDNNKKGMIRYSVE